MNGPEHYAEAERLLIGSEEFTYGSDGEVSLLAQAQVHATLALVAACHGDVS